MNPNTNNDNQNNNMRNTLLRNNSNIPQQPINDRNQQSIQQNRNYQADNSKFQKNHQKKNNKNSFMNSLRYVFLEIKKR